MNFQNRLLVLSMVGLLGAPQAVAQAEYTAARQSAAATQEFIQGGKFRQGVRTLERLNCVENKKCETLKQFTLGYLYEAWARAERDRNTELLRLAVDAYGQARQLSPKNVQILTNLALAARSAGDFRTASNSAAELVKLDTSGAYQHYLFLGDLQLAGGDLSAASQSFQEAAIISPAAPEAFRRLLNLQVRAEDGERVFAYSERLKSDFPEIAIDGYVFVINKERWENTSLSEKALTRWAALRANLGQIGAEELRSLPDPDVWLRNSIAELHQAVAGRESSLQWWMGTAERRDAISRVLRRRASTLRAVDHHEAEEKQRTALALLSRAVEVAPHFSAYLRGPLKSSSNAQLDAATDLVALHHEIGASGNYAELSGVSGVQLEEMTEMLFGGKAGAYASGQMDAIQRYHTVLGMLFYETGRIKSDWADNAQYQLYHALKTADRIAGKDPASYKPLPELERMLADVYFRRGEPERGAERSLKAAMGFLETDNLPAAAASLENAQRAGISEDKGQAVAAILNTRQLVRADGMLAAKVDGETLTLDSQLDWVLEPTALELQRDFVDRQRFKVLADLGTQLQKSGQVELSRQVNAEALNAASRQNALTSLQDVRRIQSIEQSLSTGTNWKGAVTAPKVTRQLDQGQVLENTQVWSLSRGGGSVAVQASPQISEAAKNLEGSSATRNVLRVESRQSQ